MAIPDSFAAISDVHGNLLALEAVLDDLARRGIREFVNLGDHLQGPLEPQATAERLMALGAPSIRGNCDRHLYEPDTRAMGTVAKNRACLEPHHLAWLAGLPQTLRIGDDVLLCHGNPWADDVYLLEEVGASGVRLRSREELAGELAGIGARLILCGHSHMPRLVEVAPELLVANPGSVGLPAYTDESPPHAMETGSPHARYAILKRAGRRWTVEHVAVPYDWDRAAALAEHNGRSDWAKWLRTGRA